MKLEKGVVVKNIPQNIIYVDRNESGTMGMTLKKI
jgi:hypothetical protein